ncbi:MAG: hypothetical protein J6V69_03340 [Clostridia bacterium]|nr:hypothetical protein [Clostridia bacterium]
MNIKTLLKLELKNRMKGNSQSKYSWLKTLFMVALVGVAVYGLYLVSEIFFEMFAKADIAYEALVIFYTVFFLFMCFIGTSSTIKVLYYKGDNEILMRYPVSGTEVFVSKTLFLIITQFAITAVVLVPFLVGYANTVGLGNEFYKLIPVSVLFMMVIPFLLSNILAIPIMHLTNRIRNKFGLIIVGLAVLVTLMFAVYMLLFDKMVTFMNDTEFSVFSDGFVQIIKDVAMYLIPMKYFADVLLNHELYIAYPVLVGIAGLSFIGTILVIVKLYPKTLLNNIEVEGSAFKRKTKNRRSPIFVALLRKEFLQVFRSVNYSFQYFVLACAMPVMVYFCNNITMQLGKDQIGEQIALGMTLLVMLIFATVITSFSATSISREGDNFYHTKVAPVSIVKQLFVKFFMYLIVSVLANGICVVVLIFTKQVEILIGLWLFVIVESLSIGMTLTSMRLDIKRPYFNLSGEGEVVNNNASTTLSVVMGFIVAIVEGVLCMFLSYLAHDGFIVPGTEFVLTQELMYIVCTGFAGIFLICSIFNYCFKLKKTYDKIAR